MERKNNYYTPKIEEFHIGFEYEMFTPSFNPEGYRWKKMEFDCNTFEYIIDTEDGGERPFDMYNEGSKELIRVKYLDREDIESFGFIECGQEEYEFIGHTDLWVIEKLYHKNVKSFYRINNKDNCQIMFIQIKNKSELKKLLIQLGIYETTTK